MTSRSNIAQCNPAQNSFPAHPALSRPLATPALLAAIHRIATTEIGYRVVE